MENLLFSPRIIGKLISWSINFEKYIKMPLRFKKSIN